MPGDTPVTRDVRYLSALGVSNTDTGKPLRRYQCHPKSDIPVLAGRLEPALPTTRAASGRPSNSTQKRGRKPSSHRANNPVPSSPSPSHSTPRRPAGPAGPAGAAAAPRPGPGFGGNLSNPRSPPESPTPTWAGSPDPPHQGDSSNAIPERDASVRVRNAMHRAWVVDDAPLRGLGCRTPSQRCTVTNTRDD